MAVNQSTRLLRLGADRRLLFYSILFYSLLVFLCSLCDWLADRLFLAVAYIQSLQTMLTYSLEDLGLDGTMTFSADRMELGVHEVA